MKKLLAVLFFLIVPAAGTAAGGPLEDHVKNCSVTVKVRHGTGSGAIFVKNGKGYVLTAGHVVSDLLYPDSDMDYPEFRALHPVWHDAQVERTLFSKGREVGQLRTTAKVLAFSPADEQGGLDLAVLEV